MAVVKIKIEKAITDKLISEIKKQYEIELEDEITSEMTKFIAAISRAIGTSVADAIATTLTTDAMVIGACPPMGGPLTGGKIV